MKLFGTQYSFLTIIFLLIYSCSGDSTFEIKTNGENYVKTTHLKTFTKEEIKGFYALASTRPGYELATDYVNEVTSGVEVKSIEYQTLGKNNIDIIASGLLCHPSEPGSYPVICFQNGTNVLHSKAPSVTPNDSLFLLLESIASMGFVVVIPDYPGFGSSSYVAHPYLVKDYTIPALTNILYATKEYVDNEVGETTLNNQLYIMGYSQGGWATLQLQSEIEQNGLEPFELVASSCGAGPYGISSLFGALQTQTEIPQPYFFAYMMNAYKEYGQLGSDLDLNGIFNEPYAAKIPSLFNGQNTPAQINNELSEDVFELINLDYTYGITNLEDQTYATLRLSYVNNDVHVWQLKTPTRLYHGTADDVVPEQITINMYNGFLGKNTSPSLIQKKTMPGLGHTEAVIPFGLSTINWFVELKNQ